MCYAVYTKDARCLVRMVHFLDLLFRISDEERKMNIMNEIVSDNNLTYVSGLDFGEGYDWAEMLVYYSAEKRRFFWLSGSGCSCTWIWDDVRSLGDMQDGNRQDALRAVREFAEGYGNDRNGDIALATSAVREFRI